MSVALRVLAPCLTWLLAGALFAQGPSQPARPDRWTIIQAGTLLVEAGRAPLRNASVIVRNDRIVEIRPGFVEPAALQAPAANVAIVDLRDRFVMPGMIDTHVHHGPDPYTALSLARTRAQAGFTTLRDLHAPPEFIFALRDAIAAGQFQGPRLIVAGSGLSATGGHMDARGSGVDPGWISLSPPAPTQGVCDGADDCRRMVRRQVQFGADWIKVAATGGLGSDSTASLDQHLSDEELRAIVETAHALGRRVAAHAIMTRGINAAIRAGVDSIEHGSRLDAESVRLMRERGTWYVPTLTAPVTLLRLLDEGRLTGPTRVKFERYGRRTPAEIGESLRRAHAAGVRIAMGSDIGPPREAARELHYMVEYAGLSPAEALRSATVNAAAMLQLDDVGTLERGKIADIIALEGDPLADITATLDVRWVMIRGQVLDLD